jgi:hypothetical protein
VVLPTALVVQVGTVAYEVETIVKPTTQLNLAGRIDAIAELAEVGAITPADAAREAAAARTMPPRFGPVTTVFGYTITTLGFGMVINPTWASLWGYVFLGTVVGAIVMLGDIDCSVTADSHIAQNVTIFLNSVSHALQESEASCVGGSLRAFRPTSRLGWTMTAKGPKTHRARTSAWRWAGRSSSGCPWSGTAGAARRRHTWLTVSPVGLMSS